MICTICFFVSLDRLIFCAMTSRFASLPGVLRTLQVDASLPGVLRTLQVDASNVCAERKPLYSITAVFLPLLPLLMYCTSIHYVTSVGYICERLS